MHPTFTKCSFKLFCNFSFHLCLYPLSNFSLKLFIIILYYPSIFPCFPFIGPFYSLFFDYLSYTEQHAKTIIYLFYRSNFALNVFQDFKYLLMPKLLFYSTLNMQKLLRCEFRHINSAGIFIGRRLASSGRIVRKFGTERL